MEMRSPCRVGSEYMGDGHTADRAHNAIILAAHRRRAAGPFDGDRAAANSDDGCEIIDDDANLAESRRSSSRAGLHK